MYRANPPAIPPRPMLKSLVDVRLFESSWQANVPSHQIASAWIGSVMTARNTRTHVSSPISIPPPVRPMSIGNHPMSMINGMPNR